MNGQAGVNDERAARGRVRWLLAFVLAAAVSQGVLPAVASAGDAPGARFALSEGSPEGVNSSRTTPRALPAFVQLPDPQDQQDAGLTPDVVVVAGLVLQGILHAADSPAAGDPHPPTARDRAPPR